MTPPRILGRVLAVLCMMPGFASAQTPHAAPEIQLQPMAPAAGTAPDPAPNAAPAAPLPEAPLPEAPLIDLAPPAGTTPDGAGDPVVIGPVEPLMRDGAAPLAEPTAAADWLLPLVPAVLPVPPEVRIGGSMPQPNHFRLTGETASADFLLTLPEGVAPPADLLLSLRSSVNVLPDGSHLTLRINDVEGGTIPLVNMGPFVEQRVPATGLTAGVNRITVTVAQAHRIFCGPEASFAIWTELDIGHSGVLIDPAKVPLNPQGFLAALQSQIAMGGPVEILVEETTDPALTRDVARQVTDALGGLPRIEVLPFYTVPGGREARARVALIASPTPQVVFRRGAGGAVVLQIEYADGLPPELGEMLPAQAANWGIVALTPGRLTTLSELGTPDILANTHYFRQDIDFLLPEDWLLLASQTASFTIHYGFSGDLAEGALLLFKVNGQTVRLLPLDRDGGSVLPPLDITFRANRLNPGINTLTVEMAVPGDPPDLPCTPRRTDMLVVLGDSSLTVPPSPRMRQMDMSRRLARLGGDDVTVPTEVADPVRDAETLMAFGTRFRPLVVDGIPAALNVVGLDAVGLVPTGDTGVTRRMLQNAVYPALELTAAAPDAEPAAPQNPTFRLADVEGAETGENPVPVETRMSLRDHVAHFFSADGWIYRQIGGVRDLALPGRIALATWLEGKSGRAMLLQLDPDTPESLWLISGPDITATDLALAVDDFRRGGRGDVHGQVALLQTDGSWITWSSRPQPELLEPLTVWNLRTVLGNYASWSPLIFTILTLSLALLSLIPALLFVLMTRRSGSRT